MIPKYIDNWLKVIENMKNENTYKLAWGRALIECVFNDRYKDFDDFRISISLLDISECMLKYYWNQTFYFHLRQSPKRIDDRAPLILQYTDELIDIFVRATGEKSPVWFSKMLEEIDEEYVSKTVKKISKILPNDVSWRFKEINNQEIPLYEYDNKNRSMEVTITKENIGYMKEYAFILSKLLNYRWAQLLEKFNIAPKIIDKVTSISESKLRRESLTKYKTELMKQFEDGIAIDFYTGKPLSTNEISVDHVIPWSFMYSDDIWNLVLTSKSNNSSKSNSIPPEEIIEKLKERNKNIVSMLNDRFSNEMKEAIRNNYVDKFYFDCRI